MLAKLSGMQKSNGEVKCNASGMLTEDYYGLRTGMIHQTRTPRADNHILQQVRTVQSIIESKTPLLGDRNGQHSSWSDTPTPLGNVFTPFSNRPNQTPGTGSVG